MLYNPDIKGLCAEVRQLRESILRRLAAVGCEFDDASLPKAEAIVDGKIGELLFAPHCEAERQALTSWDGGKRDGGKNRVMDLLVFACATMINTALSRANHASFRCVVHGGIAGQIFGLSRTRSSPDDRASANDTNPGGPSSIARCSRSDRRKRSRQPNYRLARKSG
jgi:hypothetical protein